jgi:5'-nucleotidase
MIVTNDDGIDAPGLRELASALCGLGHDVVVAAPREEASGTSCSLSSVQHEGRTIVERRALEGLEDVTAFAVAASPAFISLVGLRGAFGPAPDVVVSGINEGPNTGRAVIHSGTVGAALTAATYGIRGLAVSMELGSSIHWLTAHRILPPVVDALVSSPVGTTLNLNVPNRPLDEVRGVRLARLAPFGMVQTQVAEAGEGYVKLSFSSPDEKAPPGSDAALLAEGYATVTALQPTGEASLADNLADSLARLADLDALDDLPVR